LVNVVNAEKKAPDGLNVGDFVQVDVFGNVETYIVLDSPVADNRSFYLQNLNGETYLSNRTNSLEALSKSLEESSFEVVGIYKSANCKLILN
jgi:hypothetical protein